jgi:hypothetical protein
LRRNALLIATLVASFAMLGFSSTKLRFTWMNPNYTGAQFKNILVLAINGRASIRAEFEDQLSAAVVVSRLVKYTKTVTDIPGEAYTPYPYYGTFYGYYSGVYPVVYAPDYLQVEKVAQVETNFYSTAKADGELIWSGTSDTVNPRTPTKGIDALVKVLIQELPKEKIIQ